MAQPYLGEIALLSFVTVPAGWAKCEGQLLSVIFNPQLFSLIGTTYGGNGSTTFALPDLRSRVPIGFGQGPALSNYTLGQKGGSEAVTLSAAEMPSHTHTIAPGTLAGTPQCRNAAGNQHSPVGGVLAIDAGGAVPMYNSDAPNADMKSGAVAFTGSPVIGNAGGGQSHENRQPYLTIAYCISLQGPKPAPPAP